MKESLSQHKNETSQRSGNGEVSSFFCRKETHTHIHTNIHSTSARMYTQSFLRSHILSTHKSTQEKLSASSLRKVVLEQQQNSWMKSHLKCNMSLNCIKSYRCVPYFIKLLVCVQIKTHHCQVSAFSTTCSYTARTCNKSTRPKYGQAICTKNCPKSSLAHHNDHETVCNLLLKNITNPKYRVCHS